MRSKILHNDNVVSLPNRSYLALQEVCEYCSVTPDTLKSWQKEIKYFLQLISLVSPANLSSLTPIIYKQFYSRAEVVKLKMLADRLQALKLGDNHFLRGEEFFHSLRGDIQALLEDLRSDDVLSSQL